jgi:hypothetical protein
MPTPTNKIAMLFLSEFVRQRSKELQAQGMFQIQFKHLVMQPNEHRELKAGTDIFILTDLIDDIRIESDFGLFDWGSDKTNEQVYEHGGDIMIENLSNSTNHIPFIQFTHKH